MKVSTATVLASALMAHGASALAIPTSMTSPTGTFLSPKETGDTPQIPKHCVPHGIPDGPGCEVSPDANEANHADKDKRRAYGKAVDDFYKELFLADIKGSTPPRNILPRGDGSIGKSESWLTSDNVNAQRDGEEGEEEEKELEWWLVAGNIQQEQGKRDESDVKPIEESAKDDDDEKEEEEHSDEKEEEEDDEKKGDDEGDDKEKKPKWWLVAGNISQEKAK